VRAHDFSSLFVGVDISGVAFRHLGRKSNNLLDLDRKDRKDRKELQGFLRISPHLPSSIIFSQDMAMCHNLVRL
jgi:hypothetical protein